MTYQIMLAVASLAFLVNPVEPPVIEKVVTKQQDISGYYSIKGKSGDKGYGGTAYITKPEGTQIYLVFMQNGKAPTRGMGIVQKGVLSISWIGEGISCGLTVLNVNGSVLSGVWSAVPGGGQLGRETWTFLHNDEDD